MSSRIIALALALSIGPAEAAIAQGRGARARFPGMDANKDGRITRAEWRGSERSFQVNDWNRDGVLSGVEMRAGARRPEGRAPEVDDDRDDAFAALDVDGDARVSAAEWHGTDERFAALDDDGDRRLTRREMLGGDPPRDLFQSVDINRDRMISLDEWHWTRSSFDQRDANRDGQLSQAEFDGSAVQQTRSATYQAGYKRGLMEGAAAGREDRERNQSWDLEGQRELESADSGYSLSMGPLRDYQGGYRDGFRRAYPDGFNAR